MITATVGISMSGSKLTGIELYASAPTTTTSNMIIVMNTGCLIDVSEMTIPFSFSGGDMGYPSFLLQVPIDMRICWLCDMAPYTLRSNSYQSCKTNVIRTCVDLHKH